MHPITEERAPFLSRPEIERSEVVLTGQLPAWLQGDVVRTAPAVFQRKNWQADHWFDGLGLLFGFRIAKGQVTFRQNLLQTGFTQRVSEGGTDIAGFGTAPRRSFIQRVLNPTPGKLDNTNVSCLMLGDDLVAMTETNLQSVLDPETLAFKGHVKWNDSLTDVMPLAHPQFDAQKKVVVNIASAFGASPAIVAFEHEPTSRTRREIGRWKMKELPYAHSFGLTQKHVVMISHPFKVSPISMLWSNKAFIEHFNWKPETGTVLGLMNRETGAVQQYGCDAFFVFHTVNAFEEGNTTVLDVLAYDDAGIVNSLKMPALRMGLSALNPKLLRLRMTPGQERASVEQLGDSRFEFPIIAYMKESGRPHSSLWGASISGTVDALESKVLKLNATGAVAATHGESGWVFGEPLFASNPNGTSVDDGVVLTVGTHTNGETSKLQVLDARTLKPLAQATVALPIPLGFHGTFIRAPAAQPEPRS